MDVAWVSLGVAWVCRMHVPCTSPACRVLARSMVACAMQACLTYGMGCMYVARMSQHVRSMHVARYYACCGTMAGPTIPAEPVPVSVAMPPWLGDDRFHSSHRAVLILKKPEHYKPLGWPEEPIGGLA